jgi:hypothetical protein
MTDVVLGAIISGVSVLAGSGIANIIQGYYSLKNKREDNLIRKEELLTRINYDKNRDLISRIIQARLRFLAPLSDQLTELQISVSNFLDTLSSISIHYLPELQTSVDDAQKLQKCEITVHPPQKMEFSQQLKTVEITLEAIKTQCTRIHEANLKTKDPDLRKSLTDLTEKLISFRETYYRMKLNLVQADTAAQDFTYAFEQIFNPAREIAVVIAQSFHRIESLLAGADAGD